MSSYFCRLDHFRFPQSVRACRTKPNLMYKEDRGGGEGWSAAMRSLHAHSVRFGFVNLCRIDKFERTKSDRVLPSKTIYPM